MYDKAIIIIIFNGDSKNVWDQNQEKTWLFTLTTSIQYHAGGSIQCN